MNNNSIWARRPLSALSKLTVAALVGTALAYAVELLHLGLDREVSIVVACLFGAAGLAASSWPLTPLLSALVAGLILVMNPFLVFNLSNPTNPLFFGAAVAQLITSLAALVAGFGATLQQLLRQRRHERHEEEAMSQQHRPARGGAPATQEDRR
jgi:hypothetical protein